MITWSRPPTPAVRVEICTSATTSIRLISGRRRLTLGCRFLSSSQPCSTHRTKDWANFKGLSLRLEKRYSAGFFFLANYQLSENRDNGSGEVEANDTAFRTNFDADEGLSRYHQRHRGAFSFGYELPFGEGRRWLNGGGPVAYALGGWQVQGVVRAGSGFPFTLSGTNVCQCGSFVPQRINYAPGREGDRGVLDNPTVGRSGTTKPRTCCRQPDSRARRDATP